MTLFKNEFNKILYSQLNMTSKDISQKEKKKVGGNIPRTRNRMIKVSYLTECVCMLHLR